MTSSRLRRGRDRQRDVRLLLTAAHNLAEFFLDGGRPAEALAAMEMADSLYDEVGDRLLSFRRLWIQGRILREQGSLVVAEIKLRKALAGFREAEIWYECAFVGLELAHLLLTLGRVSDAALCSAAVEDSFAAAGIPAEAMAARLLRRAATARCATDAARLLLRASSSLRRRRP